MEVITDQSQRDGVIAKMKIMGIVFVSNLNVL